MEMAMGMDADYLWGGARTGVGVPGLQEPVKTKAALEKRTLLTLP